MPAYQQFEKIRIEGSLEGLGQCVQYIQVRDQHS